MKRESIFLQEVCLVKNLFKKERWYFGTLLLHVHEHEAQFNNSLRFIKQIGEPVEQTVFS